MCGSCRHGHGMGLAMRTLLTALAGLAGTGRAAPRRLGRLSWRRRGLAYCRRVVAALLLPVPWWSPRSAGAEGVAAWIRDSLREHFPSLYAESLARHGWRCSREGTWAPLPDVLPQHCVLLVHGLDEPGKLWVNLVPALAADGATCLAFSYPNDQPIRDSAAFLLVSLQELRQRGVVRASVVAHSMGGLVTREVLTSPLLGFPGWVGNGTVPRIECLIMVGTPNHGSQLAGLRGFAEIREQWVRLLRGEGDLLGGLTDGCGEAGRDLRPDSVFLRELNARPFPEDVRATIIAGSASPVTRDKLAAQFEEWVRRAPPGSRAWVENVYRQLTAVSDGIGDGIVSLDSTRLEGIRDHVTVQANHISMIRNVLPDDSRLPPAIPIIRDRLRTAAGPGPIP